MRALRILVALIFVSQLAGCAMGQRIDYRDAVPALTATSDHEISVLVVDERPYVNSGSKRPTYVGTLRALYYNPFNVSTVSGAPLAIDLQSAIITGFSRSGINAKHQIGWVTRADKKGERLLIVRLKDWKSDSYMRTRFQYDLTATVYDHRGVSLGANQAKWVGPINNFATAGAGALHAVLGGREIQSALSGSANSEPKGSVRLQPSAGPTYDQCMARVMRIADPSLKLQAMSACDGA